MEVLTCAEETNDGGYVLGGYTYLSDTTGDITEPDRGLEDYWVVKVDSLGIKQWDKRYGGIHHDYLTVVRQTRDGGYIVGGFSNSGATGDKSQPSFGNYDYWLLKTDSLGSIQWDRVYGGSIGDELYGLRQTSDGGYIIGGFSDSGVSGSKTAVSYGAADFWVVKVDESGTQQWDRSYGGDDRDRIQALDLTKDGGFVFGGYTRSDSGGTKTQDTYGAYDYWVVKTDSTGNQQWDTDVGGTDDEELHSLITTTDDGFMLFGLSASGIGGIKTEASQGELDYWMVKLDAQGLVQWDRTFGGLDNDGALGDNWQFGSMVGQTNDGGYLLVSTSESLIGGDKSEENLGSRDPWLVCTDSLGNLIWDKTIFTMGNSHGAFAWQKASGCYMVAAQLNGGVGGYVTQPTRGKTDFWHTLLCDSALVAASGPSAFARAEPLSVFPNPTESQVVVSIADHVLDVVEVSARNSLGQTLSRFSISNRPVRSVSIDLSQYPDGLYFIAVDCGGSRTWNKVIKQSAN